jgi:LCP family protein required for cell wall assembly
MTKILDFLNRTPTSIARKRLLVLLVLMFIFAACVAFLLINRFVLRNISGALGGGPGIVEGTPLPGSESGFTSDLTVELTPWDGAGRVNMLIMGLDYRDWSSSTGPSRTDTMILLTMDPLTKTAGMLSIPRDLWVSIPGFNYNKINTAYFFGEAYKLPGGGPAMAVQAVEQLLGVPIHYYAQIDFYAFEKFIDEIGGIVIYIEEPITIYPIGKPKVTLQPDAYRIGGDLALAYARARNTGGADFDRVKRQQEVILAIRRQILRFDMLPTLITNAPAIYQELSAGIKTNMTLDEIVKLAVIAQQVELESITKAAISTDHVIMAHSQEGASILVPLTDKIRQLRDEIFSTSGTLGPLVPGTPEEQLKAENARLALLNASSSDGLADRTQSYLASLGANVVQVSNSELSASTIIIDYTSNPHTVSYLAGLMQVPSENIHLEYDPNSQVDVAVMLGTDWAADNPMP